MSMVDAEEIEEGEFVDNSLTKEQISIQLNLKKEDVDELTKREDVEDMDYILYECFV